MVLTFFTPGQLSLDFDRFGLPSTESSSLCLFCAEDESGVLFVLIPRPVKRVALLLDLTRLLVLEYGLLDSALLLTQDALLESFRGAPNFIPLCKCAIVSGLSSIVICS